MRLMFLHGVPGARPSQHPLPSGPGPPDRAARRRLRAARNPGRPDPVGASGGVPVRSCPRGSGSTARDTGLRGAPGVPDAVRALPGLLPAAPGGSGAQLGAGPGAQGAPEARAFPTPGGDPTSRPRGVRACVCPSVCSLDVSGNFQPGSERVSKRERQRSAPRAGAGRGGFATGAPGGALTASPARPGLAPLAAAALGSRPAPLRAPRRPGQSRRGREGGAAAARPPRAPRLPPPALRHGAALTGPARPRAAVFPAPSRPHPAPLRPRRRRLPGPRPAPPGGQPQARGGRAPPRHQGKQIRARVAPPGPAARVPPPSAPHPTAPRTSSFPR